jgi:predicted nucleic acid-binding Zn ribbon protein
MLTSLKDDPTVECPNCGCTKMKLVQTAVVTEKTKNNKTVLDLHYQQLSLICSECCATVKEYPVQTTTINEER